MFDIEVPVQPLMQKLKTSLLNISQLGMTRITNKNKTHKFRNLVQHAIIKVLDSQEGPVTVGKKEPWFARTCSVGVDRRPMSYDAGKIT